MIPTLIIGGYLGAGKTTLLNHLLRNADGQRIAVMVNDFGELAIDADLIRGADGDVLALAGGCVCCSFGSDLMGALQQMLQRDPQPDLILIETSGVALPASVGRSVRLLPGLNLDGIVLMVDAETIRQRAADPYVGDLVRQQLMEADLLILNKTELCTPLVLQQLLDWLQTATVPRTPVVQARHAQVPPELVLDMKISRFHRNDVADLGPSWQSKPLRHLPEPAAQLFVNELVMLPMPIDANALTDYLTTPSHGVIRAKGWFTDQDGKRLQLQMVGRRVALTSPALDLNPVSPDRLLLIGLQAHFQPGQLALKFNSPN